MTPGTPSFSDPSRIILHPTDFSEESERAFAHALKLALHNEGHLTLLHSGVTGRDSAWSDFPAVRTTLERWGLLEPGSTRSAVGKLGLGVEKVAASSDDVVQAIVGVLRKRPVQLLVMASEGREGLARLLRPSLAERAARETQVPTLFVPAKGRGCVQIEDGDVCMKNVLVPLAEGTVAGIALERAIRALEAFGDTDSQITLLHVGEEEDFPPVPDIDTPWQIVRVTRQGDPAAEIARSAEESAANVIVLVSEGVEGLMDKWLGTTSEQVVRKAPCPVLVIPASY